MLKMNDEMFGFRVESVTDLPDVNGRLWRFTYLKNGADLAWLERDDEVKTFVIAFKTLPEDNTGVAHILEHSVLSGSRKYPVKSPFDELRKSSLKVFMNAMTARDKTYYPFATRNDQDFLNLADVYLDAVFHPLVVDNPMAFLQEGWRYEIDPQTGGLSYNGVVYNEMKGANAEPGSIAMREICRYLYPDTVYGRDSGGNPREIPNLTHEKFCAFYRKYYHPSNARIFLDGRVDLPPVLEKLDSFLSEFEPAPKIAPVPKQAPVEKSITIPYASSVCTRKTILTDAWVVDSSLDPVFQEVLDVLRAYLIGSNEAPLKQALLSKGLCDDMSMSWYDFPQTPFVMTIRNTSDELAAQCRETVRNVIDELLAKGLDKQRLLAFIDNNEFSERECYSMDPLGLIYFSRAIGQWLYDGNPADALDTTGIFQKLRDGVNTGLFEDCLRKIFQNNPHHVELTLSPSSTYGEEKAREVADELQRRRAEMSEDEFNALKRQAADFADYQKREDPKEAKDTIPVMRVKDIPKSTRIVEHSISPVADMTQIRIKSVAKGIVYLTLSFPIDGLNTEDLKTTSLLTQFLGVLPTKRHDTLSLQTEISSKIGRLFSAANATERGNFFTVDLAMLEHKAVDAINLMREILFETCFDDVQEIAKKKKQACLGLEQCVPMFGHYFAMGCSTRTFSRSFMSSDAMHGLDYLRWLQKAECNEEFAKRFPALCRKIFVRDGMVMTYTENLPSQAKEMIEAMFEKSDGEMLKPALVELEHSTLKGIQIDGDSGFVGLSAPLPEGFSLYGALKVAAKIISLEYLHKEIREVGGAYGAGMGLLDDYFCCHTFRDPTPKASLEKIGNIGDALSAFVRSGADFERFIVSTIAGIDRYLSPAMEVAIPLSLYWRKRSPQDEEDLRRQVLETTREDLDKIAQMLQSQMAKSNFLAIGGAKQMKDFPKGDVEPLSAKAETL